MSLLDVFNDFDAALEWQVDDPLLGEEPSTGDARDWAQSVPDAAA